MSDVRDFVVSFANESDVRHVVDACKRFHEISGTKIPLDPDALEALLLDLQDNDSMDLIVAKTPSGIIAGFILLVYAPTVINLYKLVATEGFWWVEKEYRGFGVGGAMLRFAEQTARKRGCGFMHVMALQSSEPSKVGKVYESMGYRLVEHTYEKEL